ncbi:cell wall metabolism sensor histidine kinase WalK [Cellulophaga baltica 4]|nr:cell wall metabolism sensor histidine kinase WalK [Cellulophaga baltica 4]
MSPKEARDQYGLMRKNTDYLLRLVDQLLDFRKMDHGKMNLNLSKSDIVGFLKEVGEPFQFLSRKKKSILKLKLPRMLLFLGLILMRLKKLSIIYYQTPLNSPLKTELFF